MFGCLWFATNNSATKTKFDTSASHCAFLVYLYGKKGYKLYDFNTKKFFISRDARFHEIVFLLTKTINMSPNSPIILFPLEEQEPILGLLKMRTPQIMVLTNLFWNPLVLNYQLGKSICETHLPSYLSDYHCKMATCALPSLKFSSC